MFDAQQLLGQMISGGLSDTFNGRRRHGGGGLLGSMGLSGTSVGLGLIGVAVAAWEHYKNAAPGAPAGAGTAPPPPPAPAAGSATPPPPPPGAAARLPAVATAPPAPAQSDAVLLIRSMIAAAAADGQIDADERSAILARAARQGLGAAEREFLEAELARPADLDTLAAATRAELAPQVYAAALLAVRVDTDAERAWLDRLAARLGLSADQRRAIDTSLGL